MRIVVSGGGTAGHVSPVLATVDALQARDKPLQLLYIGQTGGVETGLAEQAGLAFRGIRGGKLRRLPGAGLWRNLSDLGMVGRNLRDIVLIAIGTFQAALILKDFKPEVIFNKVGPAGLPVGIAARFLRIPMVIHEPDLTPGLSNRLLSRWATSVAVGFPAELYSTLGRRTVYTGTPIQPVILRGKRQQGRAQFGFSEKRPLVLIVGGSQGAHTLNQAVLTVLPGLLKETQVHHVVGGHDFAKVSRQTAGQSVYRADEFLQATDMAAAYAAADIVIARGGASTLAELAALKKAVIIVPNRGAAAHQIKNAARLAAAGAALSVSDEYPDELLAAVRRLLTNPEERHTLERAIASFNTPNASTRLAELIEQAAK